MEFPGRDVPDVSYNAGVGYAIYDSFDGTGGWIDVGGTSAGAPQWAALIAIADQGRASSGLGTLNGASQTLAALYAAPSTDFHDITVGSTQFESAGPGYDLATGIGTPVANALIPYLAGYGGTGSGSGSGTTSIPATPLNLSANAVSSSQIDLSWSASTGATGYDVYELQGGVLVTTLTSSSNSLNVGNLSASTSYSFEVAAFDTAGTSTASSAVSMSTLAAAVAVAAPTNLQVTAASSTVAQLSWTGSAGATGYLVFELVGKQYVQIGPTLGPGTGTISVSVSGQTAGATESFYVTAVNATSSASTGVVSIVMPKATALAAPTNVKAAATSTTTGTLSWTDSAGATSYAIYYLNGRQSVLLGTVSGTSTAVTISGMAAGTTYQFAVVAENSTSSAASAWVSLTTPAAAATRAAAEYVFSEYGENKQTRWFA